MSVSSLVIFLGSFGAIVASRPAKTPTGPSREVQLASLYHRPLPGALERTFTLPRRDQEGVFDGQDENAIVHRIRTHPIRRISFTRGGSSLSLRLELTDGSSAAFKPDQIHEHTVPRKEIAAYRLNRFLGLSRVPPATHRVISARELYAHLAPEHRRLFFRIRKEAKILPNGGLAGQVSWWIPEIRYLPLNQRQERRRWGRWLLAIEPLPPEVASMAAQISTMLVFDFLINNPDRFSGNNTMATPDGEFLYFMDNTWSFNPLPEGGKAALSGLLQTQRFSRRLVEQLRALTPERLAALMEVEPGCPWPLLAPEEMEAVIQRRGFVIQRVTSVIARYGWERTMVFP